MKIVSVLRLLPACLALLASPFLRAEEPAKVDKYTARIETCEAILREFQADDQLSIPTEVLRQAKALVIVNQVKGGLILGLQLGGQRTETIYVVTDKEIVRRLFDGRVNIGVDARAIAGPRTYEAEKVNQEILTTPVLVYGRNHGYYAGATVKTGWLDRNDSLNWDYYHTPYVLPELLYGDFVKVTPQVRPLVDYVTQITR
jgi:lipid-binding SYLF domain-containing protein